MWRKYFKIKGIKPGVVHYPRPFNLVDFRRNDLKPEMLKEMYEANLPYIDITDAGIDYFYPDQNKEVIASDPDNNREKQSDSQSYFTAKELVVNIQNAETEDEARYYYGLGKKYSTVQKAFDKKVEELNDTEQ